MANPKPFFVGYLSHGWGAVTLLIVSVFVTSGLGLSYYVASAQQSAGAGQWQVAVRQETVGRLALDPYPVLHPVDDPGQSILLVRPGKSSAEALLRPLAGQLVSIRGAPIERGGWQMLEVYSESDVVPVAAEPNLASVALPATAVLSETSLRGEVVDSKCFLGVMKPGAGKVHRACAALCLTGGMPPMLVVTDPAGDRYGYLLINADGSSASQRLVPDVAVPVEASGVLEQRGDLTYLRLAEQGIRRL